MTMLAISQKPERVSNILRSSTPTIRVSGMRRMPCACGRGAAAASAVAGSRAVVVVMLLLLRAGCLR